MLYLTQRVETPAQATASVTLPIDVRVKSRIKVTLNDGRQAGLLLPRGLLLRGVVGDDLRCALVEQAGAVGPHRFQGEHRVRGRVLDRAVGSRARRLDGDSGEINSGLVGQGGTASQDQQWQRAEAQEVLHVNNSGALKRLVESLRGVGIGACNGQWRPRMILAWSDNVIVIT